VNKLLKAIGRLGKASRRWLSCSSNAVENP
jgi:hypothetical protein